MNTKVKVWKGTVNIELGSRPNCEGSDMPRAPWSSFFIWPSEQIKIFSGSFLTLSCKMLNRIETFPADYWKILGHNNTFSYVIKLASAAVWWWLNLLFAHIPASRLLYPPPLCTIFLCSDKHKKTLVEKRQLCKAKKVGLWNRDNCARQRKLMDKAHKKLPATPCWVHSAASS